MASVEIEMRSEERKVINCSGVVITGAADSRLTDDHAGVRFTADQGHTYAGLEEEGEDGSICVNNKKDGDEAAGCRVLHSSTSCADRSDRPESKSAPRRHSRVGMNGICHLTEGVNAGRVTEPMLIQAVPHPRKGPSSRRSAPRYQQCLSVGKRSILPSKAREMVGRVRTGKALCGRRGDQEILDAVADPPISRHGLSAGKEQAKERDVIVRSRIDCKDGGTGHNVGRVETCDVDVLVEGVAAELIGASAAGEQRRWSNDADASGLPRSGDSRPVNKSHGFRGYAKAEGIEVDANGSGVGKQDNLLLDANVTVRGTGSGSGRVHGHPSATRRKTGDAAAMGTNANEAALGMIVGMSLQQLTRTAPAKGGGVTMVPWGETVSGAIEAGMSGSKDRTQGKMPPWTTACSQGGMQLGSRDLTGVVAGVCGGKGGTGRGSTMVEIANMRCSESPSSSGGPSTRPSSGPQSCVRWSGEHERCVGTMFTGTDGSMPAQAQAGAQEQEQEQDLRRMSNGNQSGSSNESMVGGLGESKLGAASRSCVECGTMKTPLWRNGPRGPKSLCNACGIRHKKACKLRAEAWGAENHSKAGTAPAKKVIKSVGVRKRKTMDAAVDEDKLTLAAETNGLRSLKARAPFITTPTGTDAAVETGCPSPPLKSLPNKQNSENKHGLGGRLKVLKKGRIDFGGDAGRVCTEDNGCRSSSCSGAGEIDHTRSSADSCVTLQGSPSTVSRPPPMTMKSKGSSDGGCGAAFVRTNPASSAAVLFHQVASTHVRSRCMEPPIGWGGRRARAGERITDREGWVRRRKSALEDPRAGEDLGLRVKVGARGTSDEVEGAILLMTLFKGCPVR